MTASKIYIWFREDFGANETEVVTRLLEKAPPATRQALTERGRIDRYEYDWALNEAR